MILKSVFVLSIVSQLASARDPWLWPFSSDSIWNQPIGADARYHGEGHFKPGAPLKSDTEFHYKVSANAPERAVHTPVGWPVIDGAHGKFLRNMRIDDDIILRTHLSNNCAAFLMPDGDHLEQLEPFIRMEKGGIALGIPAPFNGLSLRGDGIIGSHWGSQLSALGGSIRHGHLTGKIPITQALKFNCQGRKYLHFDKSSRTPGFRWPALNADSYAGKSPEQGGYSGADPAFVMGTLLAIHPRHTAESLGLKTRPAKLLLTALQNYGAYIVDDTHDDSFHFSLSHEAVGEFQEAFGHPFEVRSDASGPAEHWHADVSKLVAALCAIDNNAPSSIGGGGEPRAPIAPLFSEMDATPPTPPGAPQVVSTTPLTVSLEWAPGTDAAGISNYWIYSGSERVAETFGKTLTIVSGLKPGTDYELTIRSRDRSLLLSTPTETVRARTQSIPEGTVLEDFDSGKADGWKFEGGASVRSGRLELQKWDGIATAILDRTLPGAFSVQSDLSLIGTGSGNRTFIHLSYRHFNDSVFIEIPGSDEPVTLKQRLDGKETVIATGGPWNLAKHFKLSVSKERKLTLWGEESAPIFQDQILPSAPSQLAFGVLANRADLDNFQLHPNP